MLCVCVTVNSYLVVELVRVRIPVSKIAGHLSMVERIRKGKELPCLSFSDIRIQRYHISRDGGLS